MENQRINIAVQKVALTVGVLLMGIKFLAWWLTNSNAILTDALESIINVTAGSFALYSIYLSAKPKDSDHPYGHGKVEFISVGVEGTLILLAGVAIISKAAYNILHPQAIRSVDIGLLLVAIAGAVNLFLGSWMVRAGKRTGSLVVISDGKHLLADAWSSAGLLIGLGIYYFTNIVWIDNLTAFVFGFVILFTGYKLLRTSVAGIMDEADYLLMAGLVEKLEKAKSENWVDLHNLRIIKYGSGWLHIDCHLSVPWYFSVAEGHREVKALEEEMRRSSQLPVELFVHADPCRPPGSCTICEKKDCLERKAPFERKVDWTLQTVMGTTQHHR